MTKKDRNILIILLVIVALAIGTHLAIRYYNKSHSAEWAKEGINSAFDEYEKKSDSDRKKADELLKKF